MRILIVLWQEHSKSLNLKEHANLKIMRSNAGYYPPEEIQGTSGAVARRECL